MKFILTYAANSQCISDFKIEEIENSILQFYTNNKDQEEIILQYRFSNTLPFDMMRALVAEGKIPFEIVEFIDEETGENFNPDTNGRCENFPKKMFPEGKYCERIIESTSRKLRKREADRKKLEALSWDSDDYSDDPYPCPNGPDGKCM